MSTTTPQSNRKTQVIGAVIAVAFVALLGLRTVKYLKDREQVQMYQQMQADYFENGLADDIMQMQREQQLAELQPTLDAITGEINAESADTERADFESESTDPIRTVEDDEGPTPVYPDEQH